MKKILLATTAAICAGGVASAEVALSGVGALGVSYSKERTAGSQTKVGAISRAEVTFTLSGESDNDMIGGFGASFTLEADESVSVDDGLGNPVVVYIGSADGPIGKISGGSDLVAADKKSGALDDPGLDGLGVDNIGEAYYGGSKKVLAYEKSIQGVTVGLSVDLEDAWAIGGTYAISDQLTIGAGYDQYEDARDPATEGYNQINTLSFGAVGTMGQFDAGFLYSSRSTTVPARQPTPFRPVADQSGYGVQLGYTIGVTKFSAHYAKNDQGTAVSPNTGWGIGMSQDLGGGLSLKAGFGIVNDLDENAKVSKANVGFNMAF